MGNLIAQYLYKMTLANLSQISADQEELNACRAAAPLEPWGHLNPITDHTAFAVVRLGSLKAKTFDEHYCMLDSWGKCLGYSLEARNERRESHVYVGGRQ